MSIIRIAISIGVFAGIVSCTETASPTATPPPPTSTLAIPTKPPPPEDWQTRWLKGVPCRPPCWEGITPGQTSGPEAGEILTNSPLIASTKTYTFADYASIGWDWVTGGEGGQAHYHQQPASQSIYGIWPWPTFLRFHDVLEAYGEPSHIMAGATISPYDHKTYAYIVIIYIAKGFSLSSSQRDLSQDTLFRNAVFFVPSLDGYVDVEVFAKLHPDWLLPWQGFKGFDYYCRDESGGKDCREAQSY